MRLLVPAALSTLLLAGCATREPLTELSMKPFEHPASVLQATNPRTPDGVTAYAMADIDTSRNRALQTYQQPRQTYPSVGGDILRGVEVTRATDNN